MTPNKNIRREKEPPAPKYSGARRKKIGVALKKVLGGEIIGTGTFRFFPFLVFVASLAFFYIANNYLAENKIREINRLTKELKEIRYEFITTKSKLGELTKQSKLATKLESKGIKESTEPIKTIKAVQDTKNE
ncbi:MAG: hypothetical protein GXO86_13630 [Chlorobi bacterium]|nr:hypothetical protein [Chlorobiota bacterium]